MYKLLNHSIESQNLRAAKAHIVPLRSVIYFPPCKIYILMLLKSNLTNLL